MRHRLFIHLTWTTRDRAAVIDLARAQFLTRYLPAVANQEHATLLALGIVSTHLHLLLRFDPGTEISRLVQRFKGGSSRLVGKENCGSVTHPLRWARGYNMESVSVRAIPDVSVYVLSQAERHPDQAIPGWRGGDAFGGGLRESPAEDSCRLPESPANAGPRPYQ